MKGDYENSNRSNLDGRAGIKLAFILTLAKGQNGPLLCHMFFLYTQHFILLFDCINIYKYNEIVI